MDPSESHNVSSNSSDEYYSSHTSSNERSSSNSYEYSYDLSDAFKYPLQKEIFISLYIWSVWFLTLAGNLLVFAAFVKDPQLRAKVGNIFILNLALADFIVGINSLTLNNIWRYYGNWPFGKVICTVYMVFDYSATLQSTFAIVLISMDRYLVVRMQLKYRTFVTHRKAYFLVAFTWFSSLMFFIIPILGYPLWSANPWEAHFDVSCWSGVVYIKSYNIVTIVYGFVFPGLLLIGFNMVVFLNIRKRSGGLVRSRQVVSSTGLPTSSTQLAQFTADPLQGSSLQDGHANAASGSTGGKGDNAQRKAQRKASNAEAQNANVASGSTGGQGDNVQRKTQRKARDAEAQEEVIIQQASREKRRALRKDKKAAATLAMIVSAYIITWLPYYVAQLIFVFFSDITISPLTWRITYYITWSNSALNPLLYAIGSPKMRQNFIELLCIWKRYQRRIL